MVKDGDPKPSAWPAPGEEERQRLELVELEARRDALVQEMGEDNAKALFLKQQIEELEEAISARIDLLRLR